MCAHKAGGQESGEVPPGTSQRWSDCAQSLYTQILNYCLNCYGISQQEAVCKKWRSAVVVSQLRTVLLESFEVLAAADTAKTVNGYETAAWPDALVEAHARLVMAVSDLE